MSTARRGGVSNIELLSNFTHNARVLSGTGDPEGVIIGSVGDAFLRADGVPAATLYIKETGVGTANGWVAHGVSGRLDAQFTPSPTPSPATVGDHIGNNISVNGSANIEFLVPINYASTFGAHICVIPGGTVAADIDLDSDYGQVGELYNAHSESDTTVSFPFTLNTIGVIDIASVLSSLSAGDMVGVKLSNNGVTGGYLIAGFLFQYITI